MYNILRNNSEFQYLKGDGKFRIFVSIFKFINILVVSYLLGNYAGKEFFGTYRYVLSFMLIFSITSLPRMNNAITQSVARGYDYSLVVGVRKRLKFSLLGSFLLLITSFFFINQNVIFYSFLIMSILFPFYFSFDSVENYLYGKNLNRTVFLLSFLFAFLNIILFFILVFLNVDLRTLVFYSMLFQIVFYFSIYLYFVKKDISKKSQPIKLDSGLVKYGLFLTKINLLSLLATHIDKIIIGSFLGPELLSVYFIGSLVPLKIVEIVRPAFQSFIPQFSNDIFKISIKKIIILVLSGIVLSFLLFILFPLLISVFFPNYNESIIIAQIFSIVLIFLIPNAYLNSYFIAKKNKKSQQVSILSSNTIKLIIIFPMFKFWGIFGLIYSEIFRVFVAFAVYVFYFNLENSSKKNKRRV